MKYVNRLSALCCVFLFCVFVHSISGGSSSGEAGAEENTSDPDGGRTDDTLPDTPAKPPSKGETQSSAQYATQP